MTSQVVQGALLNKGGYGRFRVRCFKHLFTLNFSHKVFCGTVILYSLMFNRGLSTFAVFFNFCSTIFHDYLVANNREKRYFVVINRETRELRLIIVHLTVNNRKPHDY